MKFAFCPAFSTGALVANKTHYVHKYTSPESEALLLREITTYALFLMVNGQAGHSERTKTSKLGTVPLNGPICL